MADDFYYSPGSDCSWTNAIHSNSPSRDHRVWLEKETKDFLKYTVFISGADKQFGVHLWKNEPHATNESAVRIARVFSQLPSFLIEVFPEYLAISSHATGGYFPRYCNQDIHTGCNMVIVNMNVFTAKHLLLMPSQFYIQSDGRLSAGFEELLLHEIGHLMQDELGWKDDYEWVKAVEQDGGFLTDYASTNSGEDFAESFAAWVIYKYYADQLTHPAREYLRRAGSNRFEYFEWRRRYATLYRR